MLQTLTDAYSGLTSRLEFLESEFRAYKDEAESKGINKALNKSLAPFLHHFFRVWLKNVAKLLLSALYQAYWKHIL